MNDIQQYMRDRRPDNISEDDWRVYCKVVCGTDPRKLMINPTKYRRYLFELNYFGADINKWVNLHCKRKLTVNNIDMITYDRNKKRIRIIEYKGQYEGQSETQNALLRVLAQIAQLNLNQLGEYELEIFVLCSNAPDFTENIFYDVMYNETFLLGAKKMQHFIDFDYELDGSDKLEAKGNLFDFV